MTTANNAPAGMDQYSGAGVPPRGLTVDATPEDWAEQRRQTEEYHRWEKEQMRRAAAVERQSLAALVREAMVESERSDTDAAARISDVLLGGGRTAILAHGAGTANQRMMDVIALDRTWAGRKSREWADLLGVTPNAIRATACWKVLRSRPG